ncbi:MAG: hypothetical protein RMN53_15435 [Anaerolineae bacterium]|nr:hypothetical protein [Anaerolineae bacterium]
MNGPIWLDRFTGTRYRCGPAWQKRVWNYLAAGLRGALSGKTTARQQADAAAEFWRDAYYAQIFPLRWGRREEDGQLRRSDILAPQATVDLDAMANRPLRRRFLDEDRLPPILPDERRGNEGWLLADRLLIEAALINVLASGLDEEQRHAARLAALVYPFYDDLTDVVVADPQVEAVVRVLAGGSADLPAALGDIVRAVRGGALQGRQVDLVLVAVQRVKQYVFETHGLNEIRGASTLLDEVIEDLTSVVGKEIGPEVVLRAAGATLLFLAPASNDSSSWPARLREAFYRRTGTAFPASAAVTVGAQALLNDYGQTVSRVYDAMTVDRAQALRPLYAALPFEARCELCGIRPAEGWDAAPGVPNMPENRRPLCGVCKTKRDQGIDERRGKVVEILSWMGYAGQREALGIEPGGGWLANDLESLIPSGVRRKLIGVVYGDGNNFGRVSLGLSDIALGLQWAKRVEHTTQAAAALALGQATQRAAALRGWQPGGNRAPLSKVPFQVLALGGDDLSLFAWAPVAVYFAAAFTRLTDLEFRATGADRLSKEPLTFSLGVLVTDEKTPVARSVDFTEHQLMRWAKQASKNQKLAQGNVAMLYAQTVEAMPSDLHQYRQSVYLLGRSNGFRLCTTLRPWTADELEVLLASAEQILERNHLGRLQRLTAAFYGARQGVMAGMLHYAYQKGRLARSGGWIQDIERDLARLQTAASADVLLVRAKYKDGSDVFGLPSGNQQPTTVTWQAPLLDLLELAKLMS